MTFVTVSAEVTIVNIVASMTIQTLLRALVPFQWFIMTAMTMDLHVRTNDFEIGLAIVIELPD